MATDASNISSGQGLGEAQVFKPYRSDYGDEVAKIGHAKRAEENKRQEEVFGDLSKVKTDGIFFKHKPVFAQKQAELYDYVKKNVDKLRKGDAQATIEFHDRLNQLGTDIGLSKNVAESYTTAGKDYMANPDKYRPEVLDKLHEFEGYNKETGQFENVDPSVMQQHTDLAKNFNQAILPNLKESIQEGRKVFDMGDGRISTDEFKKLPETIVRNKIDAWVSDPVIHEQAYYDYKKANPDTEPTIDDLKEDLYQKYGASLVKDEHKKGLTAGWKPDSGESKGNYSVEPIVKTVNLNDPIIDPKTKEPVLDEEGNPTYQQAETPVKSWELKQNIPIEKEISAVYNPGTFQKEKNIGSQKFNMSSIVEHVVNKKTGQPVPSYDEAVINKHPEIYEKKKFASGIMGTGKEARPVYVPLEVVQPTLNQRKIKLQGIDSESSNKNIITSKSKSGKDIFSEDGGKTWQYK